MKQKYRFLPPSQKNQIFGKIIIAQAFDCGISLENVLLFFETKNYLHVNQNTTEAF